MPSPSRDRLHRPQDLDDVRPGRSVPERAFRARLRVFPVLWVWLSVEGWLVVIASWVKRR